MSVKQWLYRGGRPNWIAAAINGCWGAIHALGIAPNFLVTLDVRGRRSGRTLSLPLVLVVVDGERYLVSMLGDDASWVRNVRAAKGLAVLRHGRREEVRLEEVAAERRAPVLKAYLKRAPGARARSYPCARTRLCRSSSGWHRGFRSSGSSREQAPGDQMKNVRFFASRMR